MNRRLIFYIAGRAIAGVATQMQAVALSWLVYERTGSALSLGLIGLAQFLPAIPLMVVAGHVADRFDRRVAVIGALTVQALGAVSLFAYTRDPHFSMATIYGVVLVIGAARAFYNPAFQALLPAIVDAKTLPQAIAASSSVNQLATIVGPAIGGVVYAVAGEKVFLALAVLQLISAGILLALRTGRPSRGTESSDWGTALAGLAYVRSNRLLLGAISLDLFAVLLGGVTTLLPIFARDILHTGPSGLGLLRSGPAIGAVLVGFGLVYLPLKKRAGATMLWSVAGYGVATVVFGLSHQFWLSMAAMIALGGFDMISVVVRQTLVQIATPDAMRGRVSAVNSVFVGASNQLGGFESGAVASLIGAIPSAVVGGIGTLVVVVMISRLFPEIRQTETLDGGALPLSAQSASGAVST